MAGLMSNPAFQRALVKQRAKASGSGQSFNTAGLTSAFASDRMQRDLQFQSIEDRKKRALKSISNQDRMLDLDRERLGFSQKQLERSQEGLPLMVGLGLGTSLLSGFEGRRRRGAVAESNRIQQRQRQQIIDQQAAMLRNETDTERKRLGVGRIR